MIKKYKRFDASELNWILSSFSTDYFLFPFIGKPQKKVLFLVVRTTKRGGGKGPTTEEKGTFLKLFFEKLNIFCLRRNIDISVLAYCV